MTLDGREIALTGYEFALLDALARRAGRVLSREQLMELAGGSAEEAFDRSIDVHVSRLRQKLGDDPKRPRLIKTVRGAGYLLAGEARVSRRGRRDTAEAGGSSGASTCTACCSCSSSRVAVGDGRRSRSAARAPWHERGGRAAAYAARRLVGARRRSGARSRAELAPLREAFGVEASVYAPDGASSRRTSSRRSIRARGAAAAGAIARCACAATASAGRCRSTAAACSSSRAGRARPIRRAASPSSARSSPRSRSARSRSRARSPRPSSGSPPRRARSARATSPPARTCARAARWASSAARFDEMAERLERLVRGEQELLANVSHELRTPLARIRVALELAAEGDLERARRYLAEIGADLDELDRLVEDVLAAARLDARGARRRPAWPSRARRVDLGAVVDEAAAPLPRERTPAGRSR